MNATVQQPNNHNSLLLLVLGLALGLAATGPLLKAGHHSRLEPGRESAGPAHYYRWLAPATGPAGIYRLPTGADGEAGAHGPPVFAVPRGQLPDQTGSAAKVPAQGWLLTSADPPHLTLFTFAPLALNRADAQTLTTMPGIGPALARRIIEHRQANGPFTSPEQLLAVPGIGPVTLERLRPLITVAE